MISRLCHACDLATAEHRHAAWNMTNGHLIAVLLHFELLELDELRATRLQIESPARLVHATVVGGTLLNWDEGERVDWLIGLGAATVARVGGHHHHGLHFGTARHNATNCDQFADLLGLHLAYGERLFRGQRFEADLTEKQKGNYDALTEGRSSLYSQSLHQLCGKGITFISLLHGIPCARIHHQAMLNVDIQCVLGVHLLLLVAGQQLGNHIAEDRRIASTILNHSLGEALIELRQVVQIDCNQHLLAMCQLHQL